MDSSGRIIRMTHQGYFLRVPEQGVHALTSYITEDKELFLLAHAGLAEVSAVDWMLEISGLVNNSTRFGLADLQAMTQHEVTSVHQLELMPEPQMLTAGDDEPQTHRTMIRCSSIPMTRHSARSIVIRPGLPMIQTSTSEANPIAHCAWAGSACSELNGYL